MKKLLALNRGEIAIRVFRAATELGLRTVAIYSKEDRLSLHRFKADEAYEIGANLGPVAAYLDIQGIADLAAEKGVDAIHPGYGFLSENPGLATACAERGITFIGPDAGLLAALGDKTAARGLAERAGIPTVPGTRHAVTEEGDAAAEAQRIGYPLIVKAAFGGGGRGMRVVQSAGEFAGKVEEARREAQLAFGNGAVFLERYIRRAKHIEVQILADRHGNVLHLHERDCSVQRRHQKVVEVAPAVNLEARVRREIADAAVALARSAGYVSAGTVEFLVDADTNEWFFIEVNPRVQVEHTVTEMVTGIDIVQAQIRIAQGHALHGPEMRLPRQEDVPLHGFALQCRVTTEDPAHGFTPDYGRLHTYRSPAGFGIRLDGASAYGGAVITPYYDSLLVKISSWGRDFPEACHRMDRALREFRIRGVKTNIPFLENVVLNQRFIQGDATTSFIGETPELFHFTERQDRASRMLAYLAEVIVNGNPEVAGRAKPVNPRLAVIPRTEPSEPPPGTKQRLDEWGPERFASWTREQPQLLLTDTTFRDAHQSLLATRVRTHDLLAIAPIVARKLHNLYSIEMWGGATFDVAMRFLLEDPWLRLRQLRRAIPNICFQMLLRASNAVGYTAYPDNAVRQFVETAAEEGMDIFRIFDSLNWLPNMEVAMDAVRRTNKVCEAAVCYTGDILDPRRDKYTLNYYVRMARELERMGAHILAVKDMAGLLKPYAAAKLIKALREAVGIPVHFHTHDSSGINSASVLKAADAGVDVADAAIASMSGSTSQPNLNSIAAALRHTERDPELDDAALLECSAYWERVRAYYVAFDTAPRSGLADLYLHEMPGGQYTNLLEQAESMGLGARWPEIARTYAEVNQAFGDIVKVTPSSKVVGDMAIFLVGHGLTAADFLALPEDHALTLPNSVVDMFQGSLGLPEGGWPEAMARRVLKGAPVLTGRPGAALPPCDFDRLAEDYLTRAGASPSHTDLVSYVMYPDVAVKFARARSAYGNLDVLPTLQFFYGLQKGEETTIEIEPGKTLVVKFLTVSDPHPDGTRTVFFELNGQPREAQVKDKSLKGETQQREKADPDKPGHVGAPIPGAVTSVAVEASQRVEKGQRLLVLEAMKMQTTVYAPVGGVIQRLVVTPGTSVEPKDLLLVIEPPPGSQS
jgi:pyruvate carboxylase